MKIKTLYFINALLLEITLCIWIK